MFPSHHHQTENTPHQAQLWTVEDMYDNNLRKIVFDIFTLAGARVHIGILFSSVKSPNKSSAVAIKMASTLIVVVLRAFSSFLVILVVEVVVDFGAE